MRPFDEAAPARPITGFSQDEAGDWIAELGCGHRQHVRHEPPLQSRPWVSSTEGRASRLGSHLQCMHCLVNTRDDVQPDRLIDVARQLAGEFRTSPHCVAGGVAAALVSASGTVYTGICIDTGSSLGFCAEHAAVAELLKARESAVTLIVAVGADGRILPPCGRCRELLWQLDARNVATQVVLGPDRVVTLGALLPEPAYTDTAH